MAPDNQYSAMRFLRRPDRLDAFLLQRGNDRGIMDELTQSKSLCALCPGIPGNCQRCADRTVDPHAKPRAAGHFNGH